MIDIGSHWTAQQSADYSGRRALLLGLAMFVLLWVLSIPYRVVYAPDGRDIPALADGLLLAPSAHWRDWFTRGYSDFWDRYPEWPQGGTAFTRPAFQFLIYLFHFALGRDWASYQVINCLAVSGLAAVAFQVAQTALGLRTGLSLLTAILVVLSPPVLQSWVFGVAFAHEPLATLLVAAAFFAVVARRDLLCLTFLFAALLTKENAVWAPPAAAITIMLRPRPDEPLRHRAFAAAAMFLPVVMWLGFRFAFFGGIGGTYATAGYTPLPDFLNLSLHKLKHIHDLFVNSHYFATEIRSWAVIDQGMFIGASLIVYALLSLWALRMIPEMVRVLRYGMQESRWPTVDSAFLVTLWAAIALAFHFALPIGATRYATSFVVFAWPAMMAEVERRRKAIIWLGVAVCGIVALARGSYYVIEWSSKNVRRLEGLVPGIHFKSMEAVLREAPTTIRQIYVLPAGERRESLPDANPKYVRPILDLSADIVRVVDIDWKCGESSDVVAFDHNIANDVVNLTVTLPDCANFRFLGAPFAGTMLANGRLYRNDSMSYELPEAYPIRSSSPELPFYLGRRITVHVSPHRPARFIIDRGRPNGITWFDIP
jgi:hypothetical protein